MKCSCGEGWLYAATMTIDRRKRVVLKCNRCPNVQAITPSTKLATQAMASDKAALIALPTNRHDEYLRKKQLEREGFTVSADRVAMGRCF